ncbi:MAG TPA: hypothetical protein VH278_08595 [Burkholderiaceae bacterium]|nr:hypothetical protein [Burkholderiaceae bacterium]
MAARPSLYDRLGGKPAITAVVDDFISNVASDPKINARFANANIAHLNYWSSRSALAPVAHAPIPAVTWRRRTAA